MSRRYIILFIVLLAAFLRFFKIDSIPPSLTWDEVAWGYNAYSLGIDGRDEFGKFLPITYLESFGDFKPPLYAYLSILPIKLFGLNEFAVRFASAFLGTLTVLLTYFLTKEIFRKNPSETQNLKNTNKNNRKSEIGNLLVLRSFSEVGKFGIPEVATLLLAISPWHVLLSRAAFEANVATFFIVSGVYLFLKASDKKWLLYLSIVSFILSMYTFNTARIVSPLLVLGLAVIKREELLLMRKQILIIISLGFLIFLPLGLFLRTPQAQLRFQEVNIFSDPSVIERVNQEIKNDNNVFWSKIIHNRRFAYSIEYIRHYFDNLNPSFLFFKGDGNPKFSTQDVGQMYIWELPFFVLGFLYIFRKKGKNWWIVPYWLFVGILPAATARETPHALRIEATLPTFQIITAIGIAILISKVSSIKYQVLSIEIKNIIFSLSMVFVIFNFLYFLHNYFIHYPHEYSSEWQYGYREAINYAKSVESQYDKIYLTDNLGRPYIYALFYTQYSPNKFQKEAIIEREVFGFVHVKGFGKYTFEKVQASTKNTLFIDRSSNVPGGANILKEFNLLNGEKILTAYTI